MTTALILPEDLPKQGEGTHQVNDPGRLDTRDFEVSQLPADNMYRLARNVKIVRPQLLRRTTGTRRENVCIGMRRAPVLPLNAAGQLLSWGGTATKRGRFNDTQ